MAKEYNVGDRLYLPVTVKEIYKEYKYSVALEYVDCEGRDTTDTVCIADEPDILLTAEEVARDVNTERDDALAELKSRNAELEALLKEVMATRDEAVKQNNELIADRNNWKEAAQRYHDSAKVADAAADELRAENKKLIAESDKLKDTLVDRTKDVQHLTEENEKLKSDCNDWKDTADERIVAVQRLTAERDNLKADLTTQKEVNEELKGRYDELDSVNHEQAEKIRKLGKALSDYKHMYNKLQDENTNLSFQLEAKPEEEVTKTVHVVLNDGTGYNFYKCTKASFDNYGNFTLLKIYRGEEYVAGFLRGDKPGNFAYWWTE